MSWAIFEAELPENEFQLDPLMENRVDNGQT